jgi:tRNA uridine 5-carboxymethylaminomethyl modification enzyme
MGCRVALLTRDLGAIARMSCNPAIGGLGKAHLVREVDALGGQMGLCAEATAIQFRRLNCRKGAAVRATRVQSDRARYSAAMAAVLRGQPGLELVEAEATALRCGDGRVHGVALGDGRALEARAVVLTTGTFLDGLLHVGLESRPGGRDGEPPARELALSLRALGLPLGRLKTGTPCRLDRASIDFSRLEEQPGDQPPPRLSFWSDWPEGRPPLPQRSCHITYTNARTHEVIRRGLDRSPLFCGIIQGVGPRYCPSIEDKVVRFPDRARHHVFLEPEGLDVPEVYPNGISTSLPLDVQEELVHSIVGLESARLLRPGYAVEYDFVDPRALDHALAVKDLPGLFLAGQINGTSGYEEAAAQGLLAGINAAEAVRGEPPLTLRRDQAYLGVMVDDLALQGTSEPYRMFTARAEHRLLLREDNADERLTPIGRRLGLIDEERWARFCRRREQAARLREHLTRTRVSAEGPLLELLEQAGTTPPRTGAPLLELLRRPQVGLALLAQAGLLPDELRGEPMVLEQLELSVKYEGYIRRQLEEAERLSCLEATVLPELDLAAIPGLRAELREKLARLRPRTLGEASRIPGMTPAAVALLEIHARARRGRLVDG